MAVTTRRWAMASAAVALSLAACAGGSDDAAGDAETVYIRALEEGRPG
jgi:hypothetical protein